MFGLSILATLLLAASSAHAHATFQDLWVNGVDQAGKCVRPPQSNSPVTSIGSNDMACNVNGAIAASGTCAVSAGDTLAVEMHQQSGDRSCSNEAIGGAHYGPTIVYMAKVDDVKTSTPWSAGWFKVNNTGLITANPQWWGTDDMNKNCGKVYFKVPTDIAPGNYLIRAEVIALHVASSAGGAQFYMSCYQVTVAGSGSAYPSTVKFPGAYSATDPGILINIHTTLSGYTIPGPAVYGGGGGGSPAPSSSKTSSTATSSTASSVPSCAASMYSQCGGQGFSGCTNCASGSTCKASSQYYSQCL